MSVTVEFHSPEEEEAIRAQAAAEGLSAAEWLSKVAAAQLETLRSEFSAERARAAVAEIREIQRRVKPDPDGLTAVDYLRQDRQRENDGRFRS